EGNLPRFRKKSTVEEAVHTRIELQLEQPSRPFTSIIGRTNTEYGTSVPVYGRNRNLDGCPHSQPESQFEVFDSTLLVNTEEGHEFVFYVKREELATSTLVVYLQQDVYT